MTDDRFQIEISDCRWQMADGRWQMADGRIQITPPSFIPTEAKRNGGISVLELSKTDSRWQMTDIRSPLPLSFRLKRSVTEETPCSNCPRQIADYRWQIADDRYQMTDFR